MEASEVAVRVLAACGIPGPDERTRDLAVRAVSMALLGLHRRSLAEHDGGYPRRWRFQR